MAYDVTVDIDGIAELKTLGKALRGAEKGLSKDLRSRIDAAIKPIGKDVIDAYGREMPQRGGFAAGLVSRTKVLTSQTSFGGKRPGARLRLSSKSDLPSIENRGRLRHPVFGNRKRWANTEVPSDVGHDELRKHLPTIQHAVLEAMDQTINRITGE